MQYLRVHCTLNIHQVIECTPKQYRTHRCKQKKQRMLECRLQVTKEAMICIDNTYGLIKITGLYQISHDFSYLFTKIPCVSGTYSILNWGAVRLPILHSSTQDAVSSNYLRIWNNLHSKFV